MSGVNGIRGRRALVIGFLLATAGAVAAQPAHAQVGGSAVNAGQTEFDIPAQAATEALIQFGRQSGMKVSSDAALVSGVASPGVRGTMAPARALSILLTGTGLTFRISGNTVTIERAPQSADGTVQLGPVRVEGGAGPSGNGGSLTSDPLATEGTGSYAARGASILKGADSLKDIPQSVTVVTRQQMDDQRLDTVYDVLANTPGVTLVNRPNGGKDIYSRGFATTTIQYDGVPLQRGDSTGNHFTASSVYLDRVEVLRGAQGLLQGAGNPAGAVNLVRKRGLAEMAVKGEARVGSWNNFGGRLEAGGPMDHEGRVRTRFAVDYEDKDDFVDTIYERNLNAYAALDFDLTPDTILSVGVAYSRLEGNRSTFYGVSRYADGRPLDIPRSALVGADWNDGERRETQVFVDLEHNFSPDWKLKLSGVHIREHMDSIMSFGGYMLVPVGGSTIGGHGYTYDISTRNYGLDARLSGNFQALGMNHEVVFGASYSKQKQEYAFDEHWEYTTYDVFNINHDAPRFDDTTLNGIYRFSGTEVQKGIYGTLRSRLTDELTLILGGRISWYERPTQTRTLTRTTTNLLKESGKFTPYAGVVYALSPQWSVYASYADIFQPQSATDAQLQVLPPIFGVNYEAGVKGELFDGAVNVSAALFRIDQRNRAVTDFDSPPVCGTAGTSRCSRAAGKVRSEGFEVEAHGELAKGWQLSGGYTYNRNKFLEDVNAAQIGMPFDYNTPRHILRLWSDYRLPGKLNGWDVGLGVDYRSEQRTNSTTRINPVQGAYSIWRARVGYKIDENWSAALNVDNIFDKKYYSFIATDYIFSFVGEPRNFLLTVRGNF